MIPITTTIKGFGPHEDTTVEWSKLKSPIAITAPTGTGKTWLMETIVAVLFGEFAWYSKSIYNGLTLGGTGEGYLEMVFEHDGEYYKAQRFIKDTGKTKTHKAELYSLDILTDRRGAMIAGPKAKDFDRAIYAMIGDKKTALSTWFLSQNRKNDLCGQPGESNLVARRREIFNALIGADALDAIEKRFAKVQKEERTIVGELEAQLLGDEDPAERLEQIEKELSAARVTIATKRRELRASEENLEAARKRLRDTEGGDDVLHAQINEHEQNQRSIEECATRIENLVSESHDLETQANGIKKAQEDARRLDELIGIRSSFREEQTWYDAWQKREQHRSVLVQNLTSCQQQIETLQDFPGVGEETRALAEQLETLRAEYKEASEENIKIQRQNEVNDAYRDQLNKQIIELSSQLRQAENRLSEKPETPFGSDCAPCPLMREWAALPIQASNLSKQIETIRERLDDVSENTPEIDLADLKAKGVEAANAAKSVAAASETCEKLREAKASESRHQALLEEYDATIPPHQREAPCNDPRTRIEATQAEIDNLAGAPERVENCHRAEASVREKRAELDQVSERHAELLGCAEESIDKAASARQALDNRERQRETIHAEVDEKGKAAKATRTEVDELSATITRNETQISNLQERAAEREEKQERVERLRDNLGGYADLRKCFGARGVRAILIDNSAPDLEAIANDLFKRATGGKMALRIATQKANDDGSIAETFDILVTDKKGERDVLEYSGGELQLILILFRVAQAIWIGNLREKQPDSLFFDEAFDGMSPEWAEALMKLIEYMDDKIKMLVVITHNIEVAAQMKSRIRLEKRFGGVSISAS